MQVSTFFGTSRTLAGACSCRRGIGLCLITGLTVAALSAQRAVAGEVTKGLAADYRVTNPAFGGIEPDAAERLAGVSGVGVSTPLASAVLSGPGGVASVTGADPAGLGKVTDLHFTAGALTAIGPGRVAVSEPYAEERGLRPGATVEGRLGGSSDGRGGEQVELEVVGVYETNQAVSDLLGHIGQVLPQPTEGSCSPSW